jgi:hypothetical protein
MFNPPTHMTLQLKSDKHAVDATVDFVAKKAATPDKFRVGKKYRVVIYEESEQDSSVLQPTNEWKLPDKLTPL